jgi:Tellurite resistance protein and related permeases
MEQYIKSFPVGLFASVMGTGGLSIVYQRYADIVDLPFVSLALLALAGVLFVIVGLIYAYKLFRFRDEVAAEFRDPVGASFFATIPISILVLSIASYDYQRSISLVLCVVGAALQLLLLLVIASRWITSDFDITHTNPVWFLPAAGQVIVPIAAIEFAPKDICWFFFSIGLFFWLVLFIIIFYRITFHQRLADRLVPTLFIMIAPPALGFISYVELTGTYDTIARVLLNVSLFLVLLLLSMLPYFLKVRYSVSWWAYTFPMCTATVASILAYATTGAVEFAWISTALLIISSLAVLIVFVNTLAGFRKRTIFSA